MFLERLGGTFGVEGDWLRECDRKVVLVLLGVEWLN